VLAEVVRCVRPGGLLTIFEPDWSSLAVNREPVPVGWLTAARHPAIGATVGGLLTDAGCFVRDRVEERSRWTYAEFERNTGLQAALERAITARILPRSTAEGWLADQQRRAAEDDFTAEITKILWIATTPSA
jgi:hypothetical protein